MPHKEHAEREHVIAAILPAAVAAEYDWGQLGSASVWLQRGPESGDTQWARVLVWPLGYAIESAPSDWRGWNSVYQPDLVRNGSVRFYHNGKRLKFPETCDQCEKNMERTFEQCDLMTRNCTIAADHPDGPTMRTGSFNTAAVFPQNCFQEVNKCTPNTAFHGFLLDNMPAPGAVSDAMAEHKAELKQRAAKGGNSNKLTRRICGECCFEHKACQHRPNGSYSPCRGPYHDNDIATVALPAWKEQVYVLLDKLIDVEWVREKVPALHRRRTPDLLTLKPDVWRADNAYADRGEIGIKDGDRVVFMSLNYVCSGFGSQPLYIIALKYETWCEMVHAPVLDASDRRATNEACTDAQRAQLALIDRSTDWPTRKGLRWTTGDVYAKHIPALTSLYALVALLCECLTPERRLAGERLVRAVVDNKLTVSATQFIEWSMTLDKAELDKRLAEAKKTKKRGVTSLPLSA